MERENESKSLVAVEKLRPLFQSGICLSQDEFADLEPLLSCVEDNDDSIVDILHSVPNSDASRQDELSSTEVLSSSQMFQSIALLCRQPVPPIVHIILHFPAVVNFPRLGIPTRLSGTEVALAG